MGRYRTARWFSAMCAPRLRVAHGKRAIIAVAVVTSTVALTIAAIPVSARADGPTTYSNTTSIAIPATGSPDQIGPASPYPSDVSVSGLSGAVSAVTVSFHGLTHSTLNDIDALLVAPTGANIVVLSDIGDPTSTLAFANNATLTFSDTAAGPVPTGNVPTGTYLPTNNGGGDSFPAPAPTPSNQTTLGGAFTGINPNGTWSLYIVDDATGDIGTMSGGWSLTITTSQSDLATATTVTTSGSPSVTGAPVTFTATVSASGTPVTTGAVQFTDGAVNLGSPVPLSASGVATLSTSALAEGTHSLHAAYAGAAGFLPSNGTVLQRVDNPTIVTGDTFCNTGAVVTPDHGAAVPYPSNITVSGVASPVSKVTVTLKGLSHQAPIDFDIMLSGPTPSQNLLLLSDVGGTTPVSNLNVTLDDAAASAVPTPLVSGTFRPTDDDSDGVDATLPAPAPGFSGASTLSTFAGSGADGVWSLWVVDDASGDSGSISGGWCLTVTGTPASPSTTTLTSSLNPAPVGQSITFTATVASGGSPVTVGMVQFSDGSTALGAPVPVASDGTAVLSTSALAAGTHTITADYSGSSGFGVSSASLTQVVSPAPTADAGGPYTVAEGQSLTLNGGASVGAVLFGWDLDGDGTYTDATGSAPTLTWAQLETFGIDDGPSSHTISLRVSAGALSATATAALTVTNTPATSVLTGGLKAVVGTPFTIKVGADDPSSADMAGMFTYTVDWGDGSPVDVVVGPSDPPVTHTYTAAGTFAASFTATDKDGGLGNPTAVSVIAAPAVVHPVVSPDDSDHLPSTGGDVLPIALLALGAAVLIAGGASILVVRRRRTTRH